MLIRIPPQAQHVPLAMRVRRLALILNLREEVSKPRDISRISASGRYSVRLLILISDS